MHARVHGVELRVLDILKATGDDTTTFMTSPKQRLLNSYFLKIDVAKIYDQVLVNLVSNVIKYADSGETITLVFSSTDDITSFKKLALERGDEALDPRIKGKLVVEIMNDNGKLINLSMIRTLTLSLVINPLTHSMLI